MILPPFGPVVGGTITPIPVNVIAPAVEGAPNVNAVLTADNGTWLNSPVSYTRSWLVAGIVVSTSSTYTVQSGDLGKTLQFRMTATNSGGTSLPVTVTVGTVLPEEDPRLDLNSRIVFVGDSNTQSAFSLAPWCDRAMIKQNGRWRYIANRAIQGTTTAYGVNDIPNVVALNPDVVVIMYGTNDNGTNRTGLRQCYDAYIAAGAKVVACGIPPTKSGIRFTATNEWIRSQPDILYVDTDAVITDLTNDLSDNVHLSARGHNKLANAVSAVLDTIIKTDSIYTVSGPTSNASVFNAYPTGWQTDKLGGDATVTVTKPTVNGEAGLKVEFTGGTTQTTVLLRPTYSLSLTTGDYMDGWGEVTFEGAPNWDVFAVGWGNSNSFFFSYGPAVNADDFPAGAVWRPQKGGPATADSSTFTQFWWFKAPGDGLTRSVTLSRWRQQKFTL